MYNMWSSYVSSCSFCFKQLEGRLHLFRYDQTKYQSATFANLTWNWIAAGPSWNANYDGNMVILSLATADSKAYLRFSILLSNCIEIRPPILCFSVSSSEHYVRSHNFVICLESHHREFPVQCNEPMCTICNKLKTLLAGEHQSGDIVGATSLQRIVWIVPQQHPFIAIISTVLHFCSVFHALGATGPILPIIK